MTVVIKRDRSRSLKDLLENLAKLRDLLGEIGEQEAKDDITGLLKSPPTLENAVPFLDRLSDLFHNKHEIQSFIIQQPDPEKWGVGEELSQIVTRVQSLMSRFGK